MKKCLLKLLQRYDFKCNDSMNFMCFFKIIFRGIAQSECKNCCVCSDIKKDMYVKFNPGTLLCLIMDIR